MNINSYIVLFKELIKYGSIFEKEELIPKINELIQNKNTDIKISSIQVKKDIL